MKLITRIRKLFRAPAIGAALRTALACALIAAETFAIVHPLDLAAHPAGEHCYICVGVSSIGHAAVGAIQTFAVDAAVPALPPAAQYVAVASQPVPQVARGPPSVS